MLLNDISENRKFPIFLSVGTAALFCLTALCICFPAQFQMIKLPFLGVTCLLGLLLLISAKGFNISRPVWFWFGAYLIYNLIWSAIGYLNKQPGATDYFRLGVVWSIVFLFIVSAIREDNMVWVYRALAVCLAFETVAILFLVGYAFQLWPNLLAWLFPTSKVGIHMGYLQVTGHFVGGMAFTVPAVYCRFILSEKLNKKKICVFSLLWFLVVLALIATSRRILLLVLPASAAAAVLVALLYPKEKRKGALIRSLIGLAGTAALMGISVLVVSSCASSFLINHRADVISVAKKEYQMNGSIRYTDNLVFDPNNIPSPSSTPGSSSGSSSGFVMRISEAVDQFDTVSVRSTIINAALSNWKEHGLFGVGFGANLPGYTAHDGKGIYELEYVVRLYTTGAVGIVILAGLLGFLLIAAIQLMRRKSRCIPLLAPAMVAYLGALIATTSNPYIFSGFDYLIMLFFPLAALNCAFLSKSDSPQPTL